MNWSEIPYKSDECFKGLAHLVPQIIIFWVQKNYFSKFQLFLEIFHFFKNSWNFQKNQLSELLQFRRISAFRKHWRQHRSLGEWPPHFPQQFPGPDFKKLWHRCCVAQVVHSLVAPPFPQTVQVSFASISSHNKQFVHKVFRLNLCSFSARAGPGNCCGKCGGHSPRLLCCRQCFRHEH